MRSTAHSALLLAQDRDDGIRGLFQLAIANSVDGPIPNDNDMFLKNSQDFILRIRNHPSIGLYRGPNEGNPPQPINDGLKAQVDSRA
jgi:hypothetical protein